MTFGRGLVVRCVNCASLIQIPSSAFTSSIGQTLLRRSFEEQGAAMGPSNPLTGFHPLICRICDSEHISVSVLQSSESKEPTS
jgi:hypothetical protein